MIYYRKDDQDNTIKGLAITTDIKIRALLSQVKPIIFLLRTLIAIETRYQLIELETVSLVQVL